VETATAKASVETTAAKASAETTAAKTTTAHTSVNCAGSCHRTYEGDGGKRDHCLS
jgi:hypothetical protein